MVNSGDKVKHLEMIQGIINRLAHNSFLIKGWSITLLTAWLIFSRALPSYPIDHSSLLAWGSPLLTLIFWFLDGFFLWQERLFRKKYDAVRQLDNDQIDFSMSTAGLNSNYCAAVLSKTLLLFYLSLLVVASLSAWVLLAG